MKESPKEGQMKMTVVVLENIVIFNLEFLDSNRNKFPIESEGKVIQNHLVKRPTT